MNGAIPTLSAHGATIPALGFGTSPMTRDLAAERPIANPVALVSGGWD